MAETLSDFMNDMERRVRSLEGRFTQAGYTYKKMMQTEIGNTLPSQPQKESLFGMYTALCVDTLDPWKQNRIRFYTPLLHKDRKPTSGGQIPPLDALPWAYPISAMGGFDDCGLNWVPPVGSTVCIVFESGNRASPYYLGTTWHRNRGPDGKHKWEMPIPEYDEIHEGHRKGYFLGANDGSQVLPQWNTENYNGIDLNSQADFINDPDASKKMTYANIYGFKTPQKHMLKMVDGDYKCAHKNKRIEILSSTGNWMIFKDDHLHNFDPRQQSDECPPSEKDGGPHQNTTCVTTTTTGAYCKAKNEFRPWDGVGTPQNNMAALPQSGIQFLSVSGHTFVMDDSVDQPTGEPNWERSITDFDFGCSDKFTGKMFMSSATGHSIELNDEESETEVRSENNGITLLTACGNQVQLCDHSTGPNTAGSGRGIFLESTSKHVIQMVDDQNEQGSPRQDGGIPVAKSKAAYIKLRTGYGLEIKMDDKSAQDKTDQQNIIIYCPQTNNTEKGPHRMLFQEAKSGPGRVELQVGGNYHCFTSDGYILDVGTPANPSDMVTTISRHNFIETKENHYHLADIHALQANKVVMIMAGEDCPMPTGGLGPCLLPVCCYGPDGIVASDRVFASASKKAPPLNVMSLLPFHKPTTT